MQESQEAAPRLLQIASSYLFSDYLPLLNEWRQFSGYLGASIIFDIFWLIQNSQSIFIRLLTILILVIKVSALVQAFILTCL